MGYELGVDLGTTYTAAAVHRDGMVRVVELGNRAAAIPSVVLVKEDEDVLTGEAATRRAITEPGRVAREFKRRLGDPTPLLLGGRPYSAEQLQAKLLRWVVAHATDREGGAPDRIAITHPANWGPYKLDLLRQAVRMADLGDAELLTEPEGAAIHYASQERLEPGSVVAVYDLGGGTFDAALLRKTDVGFEILGQPEGIERLGGIDFDEAVFGHVARALGGALEDLDPDDPAATAAVERLRRDCVDAKEALSGDTEVSIPVVLPNVSSEVRLTRQEFESLIRPTLADTISAMGRALRSAEVETGDVHAVLLVGGSSRIPLVAQLVGAELGRPVAVDAHPKYGVAMGAALAAAAASSGHDTGAVAVDSPDEATELAAPTGAPPAPAPAPAAPSVPIPAAAPETTPETAPTAVIPAAPDQPSTTRVEPAADATTQIPVVPTPAPAATPAPAPARATAAAPTPAPSSSGAGREGGSKIPMIVGIAVVLGLVVGGVLVLGGGDDPVNPVIAASPTPSEEPTPVSTAEPRAEPSGEPSPEPFQEPSPEPTADPNSAEARGIPSPGTTRYVTLTEVAIVDGVYEVAYETTNYVPLVAAGEHHIHFFWEQPGFTPDQYGTQAASRGDWKLWDTNADGDLLIDDPYFAVSAQPSDATRICAVVATETHAVDQPELASTTVHCIELPSA